MCIAIGCPMGERVPADVLKRAAFNNPDGAGYAYVDEYGGVQAVKAATYAEIEDQLNADLDKYSDTSSFLIHFRIATHGDVCAENAHPFMVKGGGAMIHNGIINIPGLPKDYSDSKYFANNVISKLPRNWYRTPHWPGYVEDMLTSRNKMVLLYPDQLVILNEKYGQWRNGVWYSNGSGHSTFQYGGGQASQSTASYRDSVQSYGSGEYDYYGDGLCVIPPTTNSAPKGGTAGKVDWSYDPKNKQLVLPKGRRWEDDDYELDGWDECVLLMEPSERRDLCSQLMQSDVSYMTDEDIEDFMLSLPILKIEGDKEPLELMRDALLLVD